jgi:hypothetical protein
MDHIGIYFEKLDVLGPSFLLSMIIGIVVSLATRQSSKKESNTIKTD